MTQAPLCIGVDLCKTGAGASRCAGARTDLDCSLSNHEQTLAEDRRGRRRLATADANRGWWLHITDCTPSRSAAITVKHRISMCQGGYGSGQQQGQGGTTRQITSDNTSCSSYIMETVGRKRRNLGTPLLLDGGTRSEEVILERVIKPNKHA